MIKRTYLIILAIILIVAIDVIGYVLFFQNRGKEIAEPASENPLSFPQAPNREINGINETPLISPNNETNETEDSNEIMPATDTFNQNPQTPTAISLGALKISGETKVFLIDDNQGNLFKFKADDDTWQRLTNSTITRIGEVYWGAVKNTLQLVIRRSVDDFAENSLAVADLELSGEEPASFAMDALSDNLTAFAVSPSAERIFYLNARQGGVDGYISDFGFKDKKLVFSSPLSEWLVNWSNDNIIGLQTRPAANFPGNLFFLNLSNRRFYPVITNINGLTSLISPDGKYTLYSASNNGKIETYLKNNETGKVKRFAFDVLPEKCAWSGATVYCAISKNIVSAAYPDDWYKGLISFNDSEIWEIDSRSEASTLIAETNGDLINLVVAQDKLLAIDQTTNQVKIYTLK